MDGYEVGGWGSGWQGKTAFDEQELIQVWIVHHLQIIGEAANALSENTKDLIIEIKKTPAFAQSQSLVTNTNHALSEMTQE